MVETDPLLLRFVDESGDEILAESLRHADRLPHVHGLGPCHSAALSATRDGAAVVAELETAVTTPVGNESPADPLLVRIAPAGPGMVTRHAGGAPGAAATGTALGVGFDAGTTEASRSRRATRARRPPGRERVETYVADGPYYPDAERAVLSAFVPPQGYRPRDDATYFPIPWVLSSDGYGVLVENEETAYHDFSGERTWSVEVTSAPDDAGRAAGGARGPAPARLRRRLARRRRCAASPATPAASPRPPRRGCGARGSSPAARSRSSSPSSRSCARPTRRCR